MVLAGGGGKGAYEVGVWLAMQDMIKELNLNIDVLSGASVGALNAALFACCTPEEVDDIWAKVTPDKLLRVDIIEKIPSIRERYYGEISIIKKLARTTNLPYSVATDLALILPEIYKKGICDRNGLVELIEGASVTRRITTCNKTVFASCSDSGLVKYIEINVDNCINTLLASSAIPVVYGMQDVEGKLYRDGGLVDNLPLKPLINSNDQRNNKKLIVVHLDYNDKKYISGLNTKGCKIYHIFPEKSLNDYSWVLDDFDYATFKFDQTTIQRIKDQGFTEMKKEYVFIKEIKDLFEDESCEEIHLLRGVRYDNVDDMYESLLTPFLYSFKKKNNNMKPYIDAVSSISDIISDFLI